MRFLLAALVAVTGWFAIMNRGSRSDRSAPQPRQNSNEHGSQATPSNSIAAQGQPDRTIAPEDPDHRQRTDDAQRDPNERHRRGERRYWAVTGVAAVVATAATIATAVFAAGAYFAARDQARIAQGTLVAGERPWLMLTDVKPATLSSNDDAGVTLWVNILAKNVGHSPAQNVWVSAKLLIVENSDPRPDIVMHAVCREVRENPVMFPGPVIFPDQTEHTNRGVPHSFNIRARDVWAVRAARIKSTHDDEMAKNRPDRAEAWAAPLSKFPFHAPLYFVGCVNYQSSDNALSFQTNFMFSVSSNSSENSFPLLGGQPPVIRYPEPAPQDPEVMMVFPRRMQRIVPGDQIKLGTPLYGTFAN